MFSIAQIPALAIRRRRLIFFIIFSLIFLLGFVPMADVLASGGVSALDVLILVLFAILFQPGCLWRHSLVGGLLDIAPRRRSIPH
jgi:membrane glycosyltransferase